MKAAFQSLLLAVVMLCSGAAHAYNLVVFGDSLSDSGNNALLPGVGVDAGQVITGNTYVPTKTYASGTYSNGPVWVNAFAAGLGTTVRPSLIPGGNNYAFGGARTNTDGPGLTPSATSQLGMYLASGPTINADSLFVVAVGGNDVRATALAAAAAPDPFSAFTIISTAASLFASGIDAIVDQLQARNAGRIVVWTAPDVGKTPFARELGLGSDVTFISALFNAALFGAMAGESNVTVFDIFAAVNGAIGNPASGLSNITDACGAAINRCDPATSLFWDGIHPTAFGHQFIARAMLAAVLPEPTSALLVGVGLMALLATRRRRRA